MAKIMKWSALLADAQVNRSMIYVEGQQFIYDSGTLPTGISGVKAGDVLTIIQEHGITASHIPGDSSAWLVTKSNVGTASTLNDQMTLSAGQVRANIGSAAAVDPKCSVSDFIKQFPIMFLLEQYGYGCYRKLDASDAAWTRCGNPLLYGQLPFQNGMKRCLLSDNGKVTAYLDPTDSTKTEDGETANLTGVLDENNPDRPYGQVMVEVPEHYRYHVTTDEYDYVYLSSESFDVPTGVTKVHVEKFYYSAYEATVDTTKPSTPKLASVVNLSDEFMGGAATSAQKEWTGEKDIHGRPRTSLTLGQFRTYARNRGKSGTYNWNCDVYSLQNHIYWLFVTEYCTYNSQGITTIGAGVTDWSSTVWSSFNSCNPFVRCGLTNSLGNASGKVTLKLDEPSTSYTTYVPSYRGIENPFGHIWSWTDGILTNSISATEHKLYICEQPSLFASAIGDGYEFIGLLPTTSNYYKKNIPGHHVPAYSSVSGSASNGLCDYFYAPSAGAGLRGVCFGGGAHYGPLAGLSFASASTAPSYASTFVGSRLCYIVNAD